MLAEQHENNRARMLGYLAFWILRHADDYGSELACCRLAESSGSSLDFKVEDPRCHALETKHIGQP